MQVESLLTEEEIKAVFETYKSPIFGFLISRVRNKEDSEDIFSQVFHKFVKYAQGHVVHMDTIKSFLFTIASNTLKDFFRKKRLYQLFTFKFNDTRQDSEPIDYFQFPDRSIDIPTKLYQKEMVEKVNQLVLQLPPNQQEAFYLRFMEGFSFIEIAGIQHVSVSTVLSRVRYALNKIKDVLIKE
ncbi:MAG: RNA polymerase sigma factor [Candidatus Aureabacteria bacterium]|nr:RNA polymerase sigma factor [Candidatus Auribacterota bacterium]